MIFKLTKSAHFTELLRLIKDAFGEIAIFYFEEQQLWKQ